MQHRHLVVYHSVTFSDTVWRYPTCDKELYAIIQSCKKWKHYILRKETIIHTNHKPLQFLQTQAKLQNDRHQRWVAYLQQFHLNICHKKGSSNKVVGYLTILPIEDLAVVLDTCGHQTTKWSQHDLDDDFSDIYKRLIEAKQVPNFYLQDGILYHMGHICVPN